VGVGVGEWRRASLSERTSSGYLAVALSVDCAAGLCFLGLCRRVGGDGAKAHYITPSHTTSPPQNRALQILCSRGLDAGSEVARYPRYKCHGGCR
jgi:hypothetical protein